ncbi:hypothetical protein NPIL_1191, partial [Nephila pilipes]
VIKVHKADQIERRMFEDEEIINEIQCIKI